MMPSDVITPWLEHASFGAVFTTVWLGLGAVTFVFSAAVGAMIRPPRAGHWIAPRAPGYPPRWVPAMTWRPILLRAALAAACVMFVLLPLFLLLAFAGTASSTSRANSPAQRW